jgi:hypothetical protein
MPPRSSDWRSPNFHAGTGHLMAPPPMALPTLAPKLLLPLKLFPFAHPVMVTTSDPGH